MVKNFLYSIQHVYQIPPALRDSGGEGNENMLNVTALKLEIVENCSWKKHIHLFRTYYSKF